VALVAAISNQAYTLAAFPEDLTALVNGLVDALGVGAVIDLIDNIDRAPLIEVLAVLQGGLLNLARVVYTTRRQDQVAPAVIDEYREPPGASRRR
jgi:hypothetical protein